MIKACSGLAELACDTVFIAVELDFAIGQRCYFASDDNAAVRYI